MSYNSEYRRAYYKRNKEHEKFRNRAYRAAHKERWLVYKAEWQREKAALQRADVRELIATAKSVRCADCGRKYPTCVMDFDHVRGKKLLNVGHAQAKLAYNIEKVKAEIAKCDVVCANCHRIRTHITRSCK